MLVWRSRQDRILLVAAISAFLLLCLVNLRLPVLPLLDNTVVAPFLRSDVTAATTGNLLVGLISAYIFYLVIDLIPQNRRYQSTLRVLNLLVVSIVDAYERASIFAHETPINSLDPTVLKESSLKKHAENVKQPSTNFLKLKFAMETAHSRYPDFQHSLTLAASLSPEHTLKWLVLCDKVRLLADVYEDQQVSSSALDIKDLQTSLQIRVMEVMEAFAGWVKFTSR
ncbi:hypothetical protein QP575_07240 [Alcaligenes faecalis subsp. phenolicus]|uniref:hypothetical protein n=1 Tax=Alcaligenes nematophilus TaxID=2994643 RepID=UPI002AA2C863|nr:hypothetical protein [Alcaligenes phenolicus]